MTEVDIHRKSNTEGAINPLTAWLVPSGLLIGGLLGVALVIATSGVSWSGDVTDSVTAEPPLPGMALGASAPQPLSASIAACILPVGQKSFAFGYLEFDWDPNAPGGVPGFQGWPS
jgi:hypothetical protein